MIDHAWPKQWRNVDKEPPVSWLQLTLIVPECHPHVYGCSRPPDMPCVLLPSQEYRFYPVMPDRASRDSTRAFSGGFPVGLRKRSSVRYYRRSYRQTTVSAELCSPVGRSLQQTRPHYSNIKETPLASGEAASDV